MRPLFFALMIALLPLRGWMGDAMAMEMASQQIFAMQSIASNEESTGASGHLHVNSEEPHTECHGHAGAAADVNVSESPDSAMHDHCNTCGACQICHTIAVTAMTGMMVESAMPHVLRPAGGIQFASAVSAPHLKPPIS